MKKRRFDKRQFARFIMTLCLWAFSILAVYVTIDFIIHTERYITTLW